MQSNMVTLYFNLLKYLKFLYFFLKLHVEFHKIYTTVLHPTYTTGSVETYNSPRLLDLFTHYS